MFLVSDGRVKFLSVRFRLPSIAGRFIPELNDCPIFLQVRVGLNGGVEFVLELSEAEQLRQAVRPAFVGKRFVRKLFRFHQFGDAGLERTFNRVTGQIICTIVQS